MINLNELSKVIRNRPFFIMKYGWEAFLFSFNYLRWNVLCPINVKIGNSLHTLTTNCFNAERPKGTIEIGDDFLAYNNVKIYAWGSGKVKIGNHCTFVSDTRIDSRGLVSIGNHVLCGARIQDFEGHPIDPEERAVEIEYSHSKLWPLFRIVKSLKE